MGSIKNQLYKIITNTGRFINLINHNSITILKLRNAHKGKTAILLGNGPSVDVQDFPLFSDHIVFACNRFHLSSNLHKLEPQYLCCADEQMYEEFGDEFEKQNSTLLLNVRTKISGNKAIYFPVNGNSPFLSHPLRGINRSGATLIFACQVAYYMGIRKFVLYGVDHSFNFKRNNSEDRSRSAEGDGNHFIENYREGKAWWPPSIRLIENGFCELSAILNSNDSNGYLVNCSRQSKLPYVPRYELEDILSSTEKRNTFSIDHDICI